jgi:hypothetical protein
MHIIEFFIVAFIMFLVIKGINRLKRKEEEEAPAGWDWWRPVPLARSRRSHGSGGILGWA